LNLLFSNFVLPFAAERHVANLNALFCCKLFLLSGRWNGTVYIGDVFCEQFLQAFFEISTLFLVIE
jgi:hypothetical protein